MLKLLAIDIDGTLMPEGVNAVDPAVFDVMRQVMDAGIDIVLNSGRQYANQRKLFAPIADRLDYICENGSLIMRGGEVLGCTVLDREKVNDLMRFILTQDGCEVLLSTPRCCYTQPKNKDFTYFVDQVVGNETEECADVCAVPEDYIKVSAFYPEGDFAAMQKRLQDYSLPYQKAVAGGNRWIDFLTDGSDKGTALDRYCELRGIDRSECIAIGDNENDLALLGHAGQVWAMASGAPAMRAQADRVITSVPEEMKRLLAERQA